VILPGPYHDRMSRNIGTLHDFEQRADAEEIEAATPQFVPRVACTTKPSKANQEAFEKAVHDIAHVTATLVDSLVSIAPPRNREVKAAKAKARAAKRYRRGLRSSGMNDGRLPWDPPLTRLAAIFGLTACVVGRAAVAFRSQIDTSADDLARCEKSRITGSPRRQGHLNGGEGSADEAGRPSIWGSLPRPLTVTCRTPTPRWASRPGQPPHCSPCSTASPPGENSQYRTLAQRS